MKLRYRVGQFFGRLRARPSPADLEAVRGLLADGEHALFCGMPAGDRLHGLCVWRSLEWPGEPPAALARAALLHDVGKTGAGLTLVHRSALVVAEALAPRLLRRVGREPGGVWRRPLHAYVHHATIGAERCAAVGSDGDTVALVRYHDAREVPALRPELQEMLRALRRADGRC